MFYTLAKIQEYSNHWHLYFLRFMVVLGFLVWPCLFALTFGFLKEINKSKKIDITFSQFLLIKKYNYVFHNFVMVGVMCSGIFNTGFIIYTFCDTYILSLNTMYSGIWHIPSKDKFSMPKINAFFAILAIGYVMHIISGLYYIYFNLYSTKSYFGEKWRAGIKKNLQSNRKWIRFRKKHKLIYDGLYPGIFDVERIDRIWSSDVSIVPIDL